MLNKKIINIINETIKAMQIYLNVVFPFSPFVVTDKLDKSKNYGNDDLDNRRRDLFSVKIVYQSPNTENKR